MAAANLSAVLRAPAHPMAKAGYGKRDAPDQAPRRADDFAGLEPREADWWAAHVRFVRGMDAPGQPPAPAAASAAPAPATGPTPSGTPAAASAASAAAPSAPEAPHVPDTGPYAAQGMGRAAEPAGAAPSAATATIDGAEPEPGVRAPRSEAYALLAGLGGREPRLQLSDGECVQLEHLVGEWLARGAGREQITRALTSGLPTPVHSAGHFLRKRLETKMPPTPAPVPESDRLDEYVIESVIVCLFCDQDETTTTLDHGVCVDCSAAIARDEAVGLTGDVPDTFLARPRSEVDVAARMAELRSAAVRPVLPSPRPRR
ncbi:hypothetical protein [Streptomyces californicus]|uniref:hypothetical protein n=1 Tax=Streptomyces californicus TaxID=67351 RepID=UPI00369F4DA1